MHSWMRKVLAMMLRRETMMGMGMCMSMRTMVRARASLLAAKG